MLKNVDEIVEAFSKENYVSGNLLISRGGKEEFSRSFGQASIQLGVPNTLDTKFHIASVTKMVIAAATLKFYEQGLIDLENHPGKYIEKFNVLHPKINIHHLLSHSSGLQDIYGVPNLRFEMSRLQVENQDFIDYLTRLKQQFNPGEQWSYNSTGFIMLGYIIEAVTGMKYEEVLHTWFFAPLKMSSTGLDNPRRITPGRAYGHTLEDGKIANADNDKLSDIEAPGELYSTVHDLDKWCEALFKGELLQPETMDKMFTPYYVTSFDPNLNYGYGWFLGADFRLIGGGTPGFRSEIWYYPASDLRIIMLWNYEKVNSHQLFHSMKPALFDMQQQ
ncbi:serine hydrolase [Paenibacillus ihbetae]|uniref:Serine hydrolase n=1 Tax=Paenibacillus ihbetae TaxID=1870820 RepID=A0A1B2E5G7_9BACL|nr:serine hydrolase domain-containing protein [Paenibacillus ihbetae]ANY75215.1 serine hydrolase [Paenibacillus ihbetae]